MHVIVRNALEKIVGISGEKTVARYTVANYLYRNRSRMRYDEYLANGWPIASGPGRRCLQEPD